ncbi:hypothetical protein [Paraburkholderia flagellata]|uniref:hypothetical protein n=1 Tax=Paraburkholderia flagellata TaxID=2883241 RepID=UPI001F3F3B7C|nr:hypothetical protein [Paraburkholderia flagellata]
MKKMVVRALVGSVCGTLITACGTVSTEQRTLLQERTRTFAVLSPDSVTSVATTDREIASALARSAYEASGVDRPKDLEHNEHIRGLSVEVDQSSNITAYYRDNYRSLLKYKAATFKVATTNDGKLTTVQVTCPASIIAYDNFKVGDGGQFYSDRDVAADLSRICDGLKISINRYKYVKTELNTQFPSDSVFANFSRKLKSSQDQGKVKAYDIEKAKLFIFSLGKTNFDLALSVFPYRSGSKVIYGFNYPYALLGDGTTTFKPEEVATIQKSIAAIAND